MTFRTRLTLAASAAVALAVVLSSVLAYVLVRDQLRGQLDDSLVARAEKVYFDWRGQLRFGFEEPRLGAAPGYAQLVTDEGEIYHSPGADVSLPSRGARAVALGERESFFTDATVDGTRVRILTTQIAPSLALQIARPLDELDRSLDRLAILLAAVGFGGVGLAAGAGLLVARAALAPVRRLRETTRRVATTQDLGERIDVRGRDELSGLASDFNVMLEALSRSVEAQRRLVADASHELRTPLTSLRTNVELLAKGKAVPAAERRRILDEALVQLEELSAIVNDVVELARGHQRDEPLEEVDLADVAAQEIARTRRIAPHLRFETRLEGTIMRGSPTRIGRALRNLLDNAVKWSPHGGIVSVVVEGTSVSVRDEGPGIDDVDLPRVFDRFYRAPSARGLPGSGLGLAIAKEIAEAHGGRAVAQRADGGGALLRLEFAPP